MRAVRRSLIGLVTVVVLAVVAAVTATSSQTRPEPESDRRSVLSADAVATAALLAQIPDRSPGGVPAYDRLADFGPAWYDIDENGCSTRDDVLARDLDNVVTTDGCTVLAGMLNDLYTATTIGFRRGVETSRLVQIDHVVPLAYAWGHGASTWTGEQRLDYANDPRVLLAVDGSANQAKGAAGPASWMPSNSAFACAYVARFVGILHDYQLSVDAADRTVISSILTSC
ncbi:HNH endonuclease family protein [Leifsonia sp. McL0607]|uniref:HNH endonuclease family protein n=1 Tax=Leifsonia sp. McL0607 TaxID=3415672 RepID=UPI003CE75A5F